MKYNGGIPRFGPRQTAGGVAGMTQFVVSFLYFVQIIYGDSISVPAYWAMSLLSPVAFTLGVDRVRLMIIMVKINDHKAFAHSI